MSIRASNWAWGQNLPPTQKVTLLALADQADDDGVCWPSMKTIARKVCVDVRTAQRNIRVLEDANLVSVEARRRPDGDATSNLYRLALTLTPSPPGKMPPPNTPRQDATTPVTPGPAGVVTSAPPQEPSYRSVSRAAASRARDPASAAADESQQQQQRATRKIRRVRPSGIVCWEEDDPQLAGAIEADATLGEVRAAVVAIEATGKDPVPGLVSREIQRLRKIREKAEQTKAREAEARREREERRRRQADPVARQASDAAARKAAAELGFEGPDVGLVG